MNIDDVLMGRGGLGEVQKVLSGPATRAVLRAALSELLGQAHPFGACRLGRAKYRTGRYLSAYYDVRVGDDRRPIAVTWTSGGARGRPPISQGDRGTPPIPQGAQTRTHAPTDPTEREAIDRGLASPFRRLVAEVPSFGMRIQVAPADAAFPQLVRVSDPAHVPTVLVAAGMGIPLAARVTAIRYRPGRRHVLRYDTGGASVFLKLYRDGKRAARAWRVAVTVADRLAAARPAIRAIRPLAVLADDAMVAYPRVVGTPLSQHVDRARADLGRHLSAAGTALRVLHGGPALAGELEPRSFASEARRVTSACEHIHTLLPAVGRRIAAVLDRAHALHDELPQEPPAFAYGDLKADHVWITRGGLVLIDFDTCCSADPALDVGKFLADLRWRYDRRGHPGPITLDQAQAHFLNGYAGPTERVLRARIYEALILAKITAHRVQLFERDWPQRTARLIDRAEAVLVELEGQLGRRFTRIPAGAMSSSGTGRE